MTEHPAIFQCFRLPRTPIRSAVRRLASIGLMVAVAAAVGNVVANEAENRVETRSAEPARLTEEVEQLLADVPARANERRGLRAEDRDAYFAAFEFVRSADLSTLREEAASNERLREAMHDRSVPHLRYSLFADLLNNPDWWQGKAIRLVGHANRVAKYDPGKNEAGIDHVYESWVVTDSSLQYPSVVVTRSVPVGTEVGESDAVGVDTTGVFFQLFTYRARDGETRYAPLVIAETWTAPEARQASRTSWWLAGLAILFGITTSITIVKASTRRRRRPIAPGGTMAFEPPLTVNPESADNAETVIDFESTKNSETSDETKHEPNTLSDAPASED